MALTSYMHNLCWFARLFLPSAGSQSNAGTHPMIRVRSPMREHTLRSHLQFSPLLVRSPMREHTLWCWFAPLYAWHFCPDAYITCADTLTRPPSAAQFATLPSAGSQSYAGKHTMMLVRISIFWHIHPICPTVLVRTLVKFRRRFVSGIPFSPWSPLRFTLLVSRLKHLQVVIPACSSLSGPR